MPAGSVCGVSWLVNKRQQQERYWELGQSQVYGGGWASVADAAGCPLPVPPLNLPLWFMSMHCRLQCPVRECSLATGASSACQGPSGGPESRATNSCQFAQDIPDFSTVSPRAQKTPQCHADWDAWSPRGGVTSWEHPLQKLFQPNPYLKLYVWRTQPKTQGR